MDRMYNDLVQYLDQLDYQWKQIDFYFLELGTEEITGYQHV